MQIFEKSLAVHDISLQICLQKKLGKFVRALRQTTINLSELHIIVPKQ